MSHKFEPPQYWSSSGKNHPLRPSSVLSASELSNLSVDEVWDLIQNKQQIELPSDLNGKEEGDKMGEDNPGFVY